jgi:predicted nuclease of predicted toxin-antitoxin system
LADENIEPSLVAWLRREGYEVISVRESARGATDEEVLQMAGRTDAILLTADKDFGELVFRQGRVAAGIILLRFRVSSRRDFVSLFQAHFASVIRVAPAHFVTLTNRAIRIRPVRPDE